MKAFVILILPVILSASAIEELQKERTPNLAVIGTSGGSNHSRNDPLEKTRSFKVDYEKNCFMKDGQPFRYVAGSIHYFRVPSELWLDRLTKLKYCGLNAVTTYVEWSSHEPEENRFDFSGEFDIFKFITMAESLDLLVILRIGPFICAERDNGGIPSWLHKYPHLKPRTDDPEFLKYVNRFFHNFLTRLSPYLYGKGGPVIMLQIENEYIGYPCDYKYLAHLRDFVTSYVADYAVLFTVSREGLDCAKIPNVLATIDFNPGEDVAKRFEYLRKYQPNGPLVNTEYYPGWLDLWGSPHSVQPIGPYIKTFEEMLSYGASVNLYMFHGGTSFGFKGSALYKRDYQATPTSYDYDALLTESGDPTEKYFATRQLLKKYFPVPEGPAPQSSPKGQYGKVQMKHSINILEKIETVSGLPPVLNEEPLSFETLGVDGGFVAYITTIKDAFSDPSMLTVSGIRDRGYVYVNKVYAGMVSRTESVFKLPITVIRGDELTILVENQGRSTGVGDLKGILKKVTLGKKTLSDWKMYKLPLNDTRNFEKLLTTNRKEVNPDCQPGCTCNTWTTMTFFRGTIKLPEGELEPKDTFLRLDNWNKGIVWVNGFNIGRYWPYEGPQVTLYVPSILLKRYPEDNVFIVLEQDSHPCHGTTANCFIELVDTPEINGPTPYSSL